MIQTAFNFAPAPRARRSDPSTSHDAAERATKFAASHEGIIFGLLCDAGERGATIKEMEARCRLNRVQIARRLAGMEERKLMRRDVGWPNLQHGPMYESRGGFTVWRKA
jgi:hypothetical protein